MKAMVKGHSGLVFLLLLFNVHTEREKGKGKSLLCFVGVDGENLIRMESFIYCLYNFFDLFIVVFYCGFQKMISTLLLIQGMLT